MIAFIKTEFRSQEPEWAKRPATANRIEFCVIQLIAQCIAIERLDSDS